MATQEFGNAFAPQFRIAKGYWVRYPVWQHNFVSPSAFSRRAVFSYRRKYVHEVLVNRLGGLSLPRKSVVRLTDRPDMTLDVNRGRKTTMQQQKKKQTELASNEFLNELAYEIRNIPSGFALVRQSREQATVGRTHASMSVEGHALPPHPLILKWLHPFPLPHHTHTTTTTTTTPVFPSIPVSSTVCGDEV